MKSLKTKALGSLHTQCMYPWRTCEQKNERTDRLLGHFSLLLTQVKMNATNFYFKMCIQLIVWLMQIMTKQVYGKMTRIDQYFNVTPVMAACCTCLWRNGSLSLYILLMIRLLGLYWNVENMTSWYIYVYIYVHWIPLV